MLSGRQPGDDGLNLGPVEKRGPECLQPHGSYGHEVRSNCVDPAVQVEVPQSAVGRVPDPGEDGPVVL